MQEASVVNFEELYGDMSRRTDEGYEHIRDNRSPGWYMSPGKSEGAKNLTWKLIQMLKHEFDCSTLVKFCIILVTSLVEMWSQFLEQAWQIVNSFFYKL